MRMIKNVAIRVNKKGIVNIVDNEVSRLKPPAV